MNIESQNVNGRRNFLKYFLGGGVVALIGSLFYPLLAFLKPPEQSDIVVSSVSAGNVLDFTEGEGKIIRFGNKPVLVFKNSNNEFKAFSATCTHLDCTVQYKKDLQIIWCACHNGKYDLRGKNISGPPPKPLDEFRVAIKNDEIFISKKS